MNTKKKHIPYYLFLLLIAVFGVFLITRNPFDAQLKMLIVVLITFFYVVWGLLHHRLHHDLTIKVMLEYILIGTLGITLVFFLMV